MVKNISSVVIQVLVGLKMIMTLIHHVLPTILIVQISVEEMLKSMIAVFAVVELLVTYQMSKLIAIMNVLEQPIMMSAINVLVVQLELSPVNLYPKLLRNFHLINLLFKHFTLLFQEDIVMEIHFLQKIGLEYLMEIFV